MLITSFISPVSIMRIKIKNRGKKWRISHIGCLILNIIDNKIIFIPNRITADNLNKPRINNKPPTNSIKDEKDEVNITNLRDGWYFREFASIVSTTFFKPTLKTRSND